MIRHHSRRPGFTLIELLVVIAIIAVLASILFPVFARARENARRTSCLSNIKQLGLGVMQYTGDYDEKYPLVSFPTPADTWTLSMQPYLKSQQLLRCPSDVSTNGDATTPRLTSYGFSAWMKATSGGTPWMNDGEPYRHAAQMAASSKVVLMSELADNGTSDHFPPYCWGSPSEAVSRGGGCPPTAWVAGEAGSLALRRHLEGFNNLYADGHAKWHKWSQVWFQDSSVSPNILQGSFDPRQQ